MKIIWHIIAKDLRRHRWALGFWVLLFVAQVGLGFAMLRVDTPDLESAAWLQRGSWLLVFLQFATGYFLVTQFVQDDELTGTRMFWLTRPVSARRLLAAKMLGVLLVFLVLPVLLLLPWWLYCGFGAPELGWMVVETMGWQLLMIAPAFVIASLTDDLGRAIMWTLLLVAGLVAWTIWVQSTLKMALGGPAPSQNSGLVFSRLWLAALVLMAGSVVITVHQFLTRRFFRSLALAIPVLGLIALIGRLWPWDCSILLADLNRPEPPPPAAAEAFANVRLSMGPAQFRYHVKGNDPARGDEGPRTAILQALEVQGLSEELILNGKTTTQTWRWPDYSTNAPRPVVFGGWSDLAMRKTLALPPRADDPETVRWQQERRDEQNASLLAKGKDPLPPRHRLAGSSAVFGFTTLSDSLIARMQASPPASELQIQAELIRLQTVLELPLRSGAAGAGGAQIFRITSLVRSGENRQQVRLGLVLTSPAQRSSGLWGVTALDPAARDRLPNLFLAVNRTVGDYWSAHLRYDDGGEPVTAQVAGVRIRWPVCSVYSEEVVRKGKWLARYPNWFDDVSLVLLEAKPVARITREVKTEKFELESPVPDLSKPAAPF